MSDPTEEWKVLDDEDVDQSGFVIVPVDATDAYIAASHSALFDTKDKADEVLMGMIKKGMPIGMAKVVEAKLVQKRKLSIKLLQEPKLVALK